LTTVENERNSKLKQLKSGDKYHLHDPTTQEVTDFLSTAKNIVIGDLSTLMDLINNSKNQGIRCAYVIIYLENGNTEQLIGFNTTDEGMICFEWGIYNYKVIPKIGSNYGECMIYTPWLHGKSHIISDIVVIGLNGCEEDPSTNTDKRL
jgi:hypothetical protein